MLGSASAEKVTYDEHVLPIFEQACLNCHNPDKAKGGLDLSSYTGTIKGGSGGKIVAASDLSSTLLGVVRQTTEPVMPPEGDALAASQIKVLEAWVKGGLLENASSKAKKPPKPRFNPALVVKQAPLDGPSPLPKDLLLEPVVVAARPTAIHSMAISPTAPVLAITGQGQILLYHTAKLQLLGVLAFPEGEPVSVKFTPDGRYLIVGGGIAGKSGRTVSFDVTTGERILETGKAFDSILTADLHPDLSQVVTGSPSKLIKIWNSADGSQMHSIKKHTDWVTSLDISNDGILIASGDRNGGVWIWEAATGNEFHTLRGHQAGITEAAFRSDSNVLATSSQDGSLRLWEMNGGKEVKKIDAHPGGVLTFAWGRDGSFITAGRDKTAKLWHPDFKPAAVIKDLKDIPTAVALDTENGRAFLANYQGHVSVHETKEGKEIGVINGNPPSIATRLASLNFAADTILKKLATQTQTDKTGRKAVTDLETQLATIQSRQEQSTARHNQANRQIASVEKSLRLTTKQITTLQQEEADALAKAETQQNLLENELGELAATEATLQQTTEELNSIRKLLNQAKTEQDEAKRKSAVTREQNRLFQHEQQLAQTRQDHQRLTKGIESLETAAAQASEHVSRITGQRIKLQQQQAIQQQQLATLRQTRQQAADDLKKTAARKPELEKQLGEARSQLASLKTELAKTKQAADSKSRQITFWKRAQLKSQIVNCHANLAASERGAETLMLKFKESAEEMSHLEIQLAERRGHAQQLRTALDTTSDPAAIEALKVREVRNQSEFAQLTEELESLRSRITGERRQLDESFQKIHQLRFQLDLDEARYAAEQKDGN